MSKESRTWHIGSEESQKVWQERWDVKEAVIDKVDWPNFRQDKKLLVGLDTDENLFAAHLALNVETGVPLNLCTDTSIGNPKGKYIAGKFYTANSIRYGRYLHRIFQYLHLFSYPIRVLEIGGGFGGFAAKFVDHCPVQSYTLIDVPIGLEIQKKVHELTSDFSFNYTTYKTKEDAKKIGKFDLVISTNSLGEMSKVDIEKFFGLIHSNLINGGLFFSSNMEVKGYNYPFDNHWHFLNVEHLGTCVVEKVAVRII